MNSLLRVVGLIVLMQLLVVVPVNARGPGGVNVIVVPARRGMVNLGFDMAALRKAKLIAYQSVGIVDDPVLHFWHAENRQWVPLSMDAFSFGGYVGSQPDRLYLVGTSRELSPAILDAAKHAQNVVTIDTLRVAEAINVLDETLNFSKREWLTLAERYQLEIEDRNWARRKWGRYGPPKKDQATVPVEMDVTPAPAPVAVPVAPVDDADGSVETVAPDDAVTGPVEASEPAVEPADK